MLKRVLSAVAVGALIGISTCPAWSQEARDIRWGTPPVGTSGHKALVTLAAVLNKEMPKYRISVLPTAGAIATVKGFATKELESSRSPSQNMRMNSAQTCQPDAIRLPVPSVAVAPRWKGCGSNSCAKAITSASVMAREGRG